MCLILIYLFVIVIVRSQEVGGRIGSGRIQISERILDDTKNIYERRRDKDDGGGRLRFSRGNADDSAVYSNSRYGGNNNNGRGGNNADADNYDAPQQRSNKSRYDSSRGAGDLIFERRRDTPNRNNKVQHRLTS